MQPERKIEKLLRTFAKQRRADAGDAFKLHPATRRILQAAAARQAPKPAETGWLLKLLGGLRPGFVMVAGFAVLVFMGAALLLPGLSKAKSRSQMAGAMGNLKQIGLATRQFADENNQQLPSALSEIQPFAGTNALMDPASGKPFVYVAGGRSVGSLRADSVLAYSPEDSKSRAVLFADGHVEAVDRPRFSEITNRGLIQLAAADSAARRELAAVPAAAPMIAATDYAAAKAAAPAALALSRDASEKRKLETDTRLQQETPATVAAGTVAAGASADRESKLDGRNPASGLFFNTPGAATSLPQGQAGVAQSFALNAGNAGLQNVFKNAAASAKVAPVLANFQLQQNGAAIAVVDGDGSVYHGYLLADEPGIQNSPAAAKKLPALAAPPPGAQDKDAAVQNKTDLAQNYFFRVTGTNRSLNQNVVFTGNVRALLNSATWSAQSSFGGGGSGGGNKLSQSSELNQFPSQLGIFSNSRIEGTAVINNTNAIEINALPVVP